MKIFTTEHIRAIDRATIEDEGVSSSELIHRAAEGIAEVILKRFSPSRPTVIFAGPGNNGADALLVAKLLIEAGFRPHVLLFNFNGNSLSRDCNAAYRELLTVGLPFDLTEIRDRAEIPLLTPAHLVIDGLFGTGLRDPLSGGFTMLARTISESGATVVAIDVPSGMFSDWNARIIARNVVHADLTLCIQFPRLSFFLADNDRLVGEWQVIDIGLSRKAIEETPAKFYYVEREDIQAVLRPRGRFTSKADYGQALLLAGSYGMMGAAVMAAMGALRSGVGKLTVHSPRLGFQTMQTRVPEALFSADKDEIVISDMIPRFTYNAVGVGPGIGTNDATRGAFETLVKTMKRPLVIDADGLNILARTPLLFDHLPPGTILTPHAGEFDRMFGAQSSAEARLLKALEMSRKLKCIIVLKGHYTATVRPDGKVFFNSTGTPAMATAGSGDVLTGIITSLLAQGYKPEVAAIAGVYIHGLAGELAAAEQGTYGVTGTDIADHTGRALRSLGL